MEVNGTLSYCRTSLVINFYYPTSYYFHSEHIPAPTLRSFLYRDSKYSLSNFIYRRPLCLLRFRTNCSDLLSFRRCTCFLYVDSGIKCYLPYPSCHVNRVSCPCVYVWAYMDVCVCMCVDSSGRLFTHENTFTWNSLEANRYTVEVLEELNATSICEFGMKYSELGRVLVIRRCEEEPFLCEFELPLKYTSEVSISDLEGQYWQGIYFVSNVIPFH